MIMNSKTGKPKLLLHACCAPCLPHPLQKLQKNYLVTVFFFNPNIHPHDEYRARLEEIESFSRRWNFPLILGEYTPKEWLETVKGHENDPEGGERCRICYHYRLKETAERARIEDIEVIATTLSVSPLKKAALINQAGRDAVLPGDLIYLEEDFKKKDGFKISCRVSREEGFYRQSYCGCVFSRKERRTGDNR